MKCKDIHSDLIFYRDGDLPPDRNKTVKTHLETCSECFQLYEHLKASLDVIEREKNVEQNPFLYSKIIQKLKDLETQKQVRVYEPVFSRIFQPVMIIGLLVIGTYTGISIGNSFQVNPQKNISTSHSAEYYFNDLQQEKLESFLLKD